MPVATLSFIVRQSLLLIVISIAAATGVVAYTVAAQDKPSQDKPAQDKKDRAKNNQDLPVQLHSDLVVTSVTVTDPSGAYVHGLTTKNFSIFEDGTVQKLDSFSAEEAPFAAAILVDMSGSMEWKFGLVRGAAASFIESIRDNDQVAVYGFNNKIKLFQDFTDSHYITDYIWDAAAEESTKLYDCLDEAVDALSKRSEKRRAILMITDGWDSSSHKASLGSVLKKAHGAGVTVYAIDLVDDNLLIGGASYVTGLTRGRAEMKELASQTGGRYVHSPDGDKLDQAFTDIVDELRNQYTLTYYSTNDKRDGRWRKLAVTMSRPDLTARTRRGYFAPKPE